MSGQFWGVFFVLAIIGFSLAGAGAVMKAIDMAKECKVNSDCAQNSYCGSDFSCHDYPNIQNTIVKNDFTVPAVVLGLSIVLAAMILRRSRNRSNRAAGF